MSFLPENCTITQKFFWEWKNPNPELEIGSEYKCGHCESMEKAFIILNNYEEKFQRSKKILEDNRKFLEDHKKIMETICKDVNQMMEQTLYVISRKYEAEVFQIIESMAIWIEDKKEEDDEDDEDEKNLGSE